MSTPRRSRGDTLDSTASSSPRNSANDPPPATSYLTPNQPPVYASFSPATLSSSSNAQPTSAAKRLSTILVHQKSPLLLATPPQVTRALAYSHPFLLPLNKLAGLVTWTTGDPWESFLLLGVFWAVVLYGDVVVRFAGPVVLVLLLIGGMYGRRFSPLSSSGWREDGGAGGGAPAKSKSKTKSKGKGSSSTDSSTGGGAKGEDPPGATASAAAGGGGHARLGSEATNTKHQKTLDEIVETLKEFTARCNILLEPLLELTDFLSTQRTATSATTRPALTRLMIRILLCTPFWAALTLPPFRVVTTRRVMLCFGTIVLTWHARVVKAGRTILWRSASVRRLASLLTGLEISVPGKSAPGSKKTKAQEALEKTQLKASGSKSAGRAASSRESELTKAIRRARGANDAGVRFTFIIYENQRRWVGLGWTNSLFAYERAAWTDEHNNQVPAKDKFELPEVEEDSTMCWRWVEGSRWRVDGVPDEAVSARDGDEGNWDYDGEGGKNGWVYYDNKVCLRLRNAHALEVCWRGRTRLTLLSSGKTAAAAKMAGEDGHAGGSGIATPNWSRSTAATKRPRPHGRKCSKTRKIYKHQTHRYTVTSGRLLCRHDRQNPPLHHLSRPPGSNQAACQTSRRIASATRSRKYEKKAAALKPATTLRLCSVHRPALRGSGCRR